MTKLLAHVVNLAPVLLAWTLGSLSAAQTALYERQRRMLPYSSVGPAAVLTQVDADAYPDLVFADAYSVGTTGLALWKGTGFGSFVPASTFGPAQSGYGTATLLSDDLDLDGNADLALFREAQCLPFTSGCFSGVALAWLGDGSGGFAPVPNAFPGADALRLMLAESGDLSGDGLPEIVAGTARHSWQNPFMPSQTFYEGGGPARWTNLGGGMFAAPATAFPDGQLADTTALALVDVDVDGDLDFVRAQAANQVFKNLGGGAFGSGVFFSNGTTSSTKDFLALDADLDGDPDLVSATAFSGPGETRLLRNDGSGTFVATTGTTPEYGFAFSLAATDANGDGRTDALLRGTYEVALWLGSGSGFTAGTPLADSDAPGALLVSDLDRDTDLDLVVPRYQGPLAFLQSATHAFAKVSTPNSSRIQAAVELALFDREGDGDLDVVLSSPSDWNELLENDGTGKLPSAAAGEWTNAYTAGSGNHNGYGLAVADIEGDGDVDMVTARAYANESLTYVNQGGSFSSRHDFPTAKGGIAASLADVDGNGYADAIFSIDLFQASGVQLHLNSAGSFAPAAGAFPGALPTTRQLMADIDGDGDADLLQPLNGFSAHPLLSARLNHWPQPFAPTAQSIPAVSSQAAAIAVSDVDADGDLDVWVGMGDSSGPAQPRLLLNTPTALVDASANLPSQPLSTSEVVAADLDDDGDEDALLVNGGGLTRLYSNTGSGSFVDASAALPSGNAIHTAVRARLGDLDGDGDLDLVSAGYGEVDVWFHMKRQLAWSNVPAIGRPLDFELHGAPGSPWVLAGSAQAAQIPLGAFGTLLLDPTTLVVLGQGLQDANGEAHKTFQVPHDPSLVGAELRAQALLGVPLQLGNLERVLFTNL
jgi:hypothetical protein